MASNCPAQNAQPWGAKLPPNSLISPINGSIHSPKQTPVRKTSFHREGRVRARSHGSAAVRRVRNPDGKVHAGIGPAAGPGPSTSESKKTGAAFEAAQAR